jgi:PAS domain S-box-containing protein
MFQTSIYFFLILLAATIISFLLALRSWKARSHILGAQALTLQLIVVAIWCLSYGFELIEPSLAGKIFWAKLEYVGIAIAPIAWLRFMVQYSGYKLAANKWLQFGIWVVPAITLILVWTNEIHGLIWSSLWLVTYPQAVIMEVEHGLWFWCHVVFSYGVLVASTILTLALIKRYPIGKRPEGLALFVGAVVPWIGNGLYLLQLTPIPGLDVTPFALAISSLTITWGLFQIRFIGIRPLAREKAVESMLDLMFALDEQGYIVDINASARRVFNISDPLPRNLKFQEILDLSPSISQEDFLVPKEQTGEGGIMATFNGRSYEIQSSPLGNPQDISIGQVILLHDVSHHMRIEQRLQIQFGVSRVLADETNLDSAAPSILKLVCTSLNFHCGGIWEIEDSPEEMGLIDLWCLGQPENIPEETRSDFRINFANGVLGQVAASGDPQFLDELTGGAPCMVCSYVIQLGCNSGVALPVRVGEKILGLVAFFSFESFFQRDQLDLLCAISSQIGQAIVRHQAEMALREREGKYKSLTDQLPVGLYRSTIDGRMLHANPAIASILGYATPEEVTQKANTLHIYEEANFREKKLARWKSTPGPHTDIYPVITTDNRRIWVRDTGQAFLGNDGEIAYMDGIVEDITEQKMAEDELRESEQRYRDLFFSAQNQARELGLLNMVRNDLSRELDLKVVFQKIVKAVSGAYGYSLVSLYLLNGDVLELQSQIGYEQVYARIPIDKGIIGRVARTGQPAIVTNTQESPEFLEVAQGIVSEVAIPLWDQGKVVGVLNAESNIVNQLTENDLRILSVLGQHVSIAIERARLYTESHDNEQKYHNVIEHSIDGIILANEQGEIIEWNEGEARITGFPKEEVLGRKLWDVERNLLAKNQATDESYQATIELVRFVFETGTLPYGEEAIEQTIIRKDGELRHLQIMLSPVKSAKGNMLSVVTRDITESRQAENALRRRDTVLSAVAFAASQFLKTPDWKDCIQVVLERLALATQTQRVYIYRNLVDEANHLFAQHQFTWQETKVNLEINQRPPLKFGYSAAGLDHWQAWFEKGESIFGSVISLSIAEKEIYKDRGVRSMAVIPVFVGQTWWGVIGFEDLSSEREWTASEIEGLKTAADILGTDIQRSETEMALRQSEVHNQAILDAIPDPMFRIKWDGTILGAEKRNFSGNSISSDINEILTPDDLKRVTQGVNLALKSKEIQLFEFEHANIEQKSSFEVRLVVCGEQEVLAIVRDVSERVRLEQMKSDFINRAAHDLRTPLTTVTMMIDLIREGGTDAELAHFWETLQLELKRERELIEKLLTVGRLESGGYLLKKQEIDLVQVMEKSLTAIQSLAFSRFITLENCISDRLPSIFADPSALEQVFINLLSNAVKFSRPGGVVSLKAQAADGWIVVDVCDTGIGIPIIDQANLFQRFFRASNAIEEEIQGTGMGLFIVKTLLELQGGAIGVKSQVGEGTTFSMLLPEMKK